MYRRIMTARFAIGLLLAMSPLMGATRECLAQATTGVAAQVVPGDNAVPEAFRSRDADGDGFLKEQEFVAGGGQEIPVLRRDFLVFDADRNGRMSVAEFLTVPAFTPENQRSAIPDPVVLLSEASLSNLTKHWGEWDQDGDGSLAADEFKTAAIGRRIRGLETTGFDGWDLDHDGKVTREEAARLLDVAFGVCVATGERLRSKSGNVADWRGFRGMDPDGDGRVTREEYLRMMSSAPNPEELYRIISKDDADSFGIAEFIACPYHTTPVAMFLSMDADLNGRLTREELVAIPADWGPPAKTWLTGFDDNDDGGYSLREFMLIPHVNLLAVWHSAQDSNQDGKLSLEEFRPVPAPALAALSAEFFRRLDVNQDQSLLLSEWPFQTSHPEAKFSVLDADADDEFTEAEFLAEKSLPADRLRRDFKVFDADGNGRMTRAEFLTIPHWVGEHHQTTVLDPVVQLSQASLSSLTEHWAEWDRDGDGSLSEGEFKAASPGRSLRGLEAVGFADWDIMDHDGKVSKEEAARLLDVAFGIRVATGEALRSKSGHVVDWGFFRTLDPDGNGRVTREEYMRVMSAVPDADAWYRGIAKDGGDSFGVAEFVVSNHRTSPVTHFLALDVDLDGRLSPEELKAVPWGPPVKKWLAGFDDDGDGAYSLREFLRIPYINLITAWHVAQDSNQDGKLSLDEFRFAPAPAFAAVAAEYFRRLDLDQDQSLSLSEWPFQTSHPKAKFTVLDGDSDGELTEAEFLAEASLPADRLRRDFKVFDTDGNDRMTQTEFLTIPHWVPEGSRGTIPDPVVLLSEASLSDLTKNWGEWDKNGDGVLDAGEFKASTVGRRVRGMEMTGFSDWDLNHDSKVSREEAALLLDIAFGVRSPTQELLRNKFGQVVDWRGFLGMSPDKNGKVRREAYVKLMGSNKPEEWFPTIYATGNETFGVNEFITSNHKTDPISQFLGMDVDLDGRLSPGEMDAIPVGWGPPGKNWLAGFDDDGDGAYSLQEFRLIPHINLLANWHAVQDTNHDGKLSPQEFRFMPAPALAALSMEYFRRLDTDQDGFLAIKEWPFAIDLVKVPREVVLQQRDRDGNGLLSFDEVLGDLRRPASTGPVDRGLETLLVRIEEAFRRADTNKDGSLDRTELASDDGLEALAPGALVQSKSVVVPPAVPIAKALGMDEATVRTYAIIEFNILLVVAVGIYLYRRRGQKNE